MSEEPDFTPRRPMFNANSAIIAFVGIVMTGCMLWVGNTLQKNNDNITELRTTLPYVQQAIVRLEGQIGGLVTRSELESRMKHSEENAAKAQELMLLRMQQQNRDSKQP